MIGCKEATGGEIVMLPSSIRGCKGQYVLAYLCVRKGDEKVETEELMQGD
jgi:hypothetical protein